MKVYVAIETSQGVGNDTSIFMTEESARKIEKRCLVELPITPTVIGATALSGEQRPESPSASATQCPR